MQQLFRKFIAPRRIIIDVCMTTQMTTKACLIAPMLSKCVNYKENSSFSFTTVFLVFETFAHQLFIVDTSISAPEKNHEGNKR